MRGMAAALVVVFALAAATYVAGRAQSGSADRHYQLAGWGSEATLEVRDDGQGGILFAPGIRFVDPPVNAERAAAYRLDLQSKDMVGVALERWTTAPGAITQCDRAGLAPSVVDVKSGELHLGGRAVPIGGSVVQARLDPSGELVAVLSASGVRLPNASPIPGLGAGGIVGWRYHQLVGRSTAAVVGPRVSLGMGVSDPIPCWTPRGEMVVYADAAFTNVALVVVRG